MNNPLELVIEKGETTVVVSIDPQKRIRLALTDHEGVMGIVLTKQQWNYIKGFIDGSLKEEGG